MAEIFRCTYSNENCGDIPKEKQALLVEYGKSIPEGYGLYLFQSIDDRMPTTKNSFLIPAGTRAGSFIRKTANTISLEFTSDIPDRSLFLTRKCNSNCIMCPYSEKFRSGKDEVEFSSLIKYIELMSTNTDYICITGGEPTLRKEEFFDVLELIKHRLRFAIVHILTNGRTFCYSDFLERYRQVRPYSTLLGIPLHAASPELHDSITQSKGSFDETIAALGQLLKFNEKIELRIVTSALNRDDLPNIAKYIAKHFPNVYTVCFMGLEMMGNSMINRNKVWCNYDSLWPYIREATEILISNAIPVQLYNYPLCAIEEKYHPLYRKSITANKVVYKDECAVCEKKDECGGFFRTTIHMEDISVKPYFKEF